MGYVIILILARSLILVDSSETGYFLDFDHLHLTPVQPLNILLLEEQNA